MTIGHSWTDIEVAIRNVHTGEVRVHHDSGRIMADGSFWDFMWADGNYACDCNRALFFARAGNEPDVDIDCGDSMFQIVSIVESATGRLLYTETVPNDNSVITRHG